MHLFTRIALLFLTLLGSGYLFFINAKTVDKNAVCILENIKTLDTFKEEKESFDYLNYLRVQAGMSSFLLNQNLQDAARLHAKYLIKNDVIGHIQEVGKAHFTGELPKDRVLKAGYQSGMSMENISSHTIGYRASVDGLFSAIYHRFGFLDFQVDEMGIGVLQDESNKSKSAYVYKMGIYEINDLCKKSSYDGKKAYVYNVCADKDFRIEKSIFDAGYNACYLRNKKVVIYPFEGQKDVPPAFFDEIPDPLPSHRVSGFPVSIQFNPYYFKYVQLEKFALYLDGVQQEAKVVDHIADLHGKFKRGEFALFPLKRLEWGREYRVEVAYKIGKERFNKRWHFETQMLSTVPIMIEENKQQVEISASKEHILYFKPKHPNDILSDVEFTGDVDVRFIDKNTLKITTKAEVGSVCKLTVSGREITLLVKP